MRVRRLVIPLVASLVAVTACSDDGSEATGSDPAPAATEDGVTSAPAPETAETIDATTASSDESATTSPSGSTAPDASAPTTGAGGEVQAGEAFPAGRCAANEAAGAITYLSGFDFAAAASIVDVIVAEEAGYYDDLCLDVEIRSSFSTDNYPFVAGGEVQFAAGGSFSEVVNYAGANEAELVAVVIEGRTAIDTLITVDPAVTSLQDVAGTTIGVKGVIPPSVAAMLAGAGLVEGEDYDTVPLVGFDPLVHAELDGIAGFPGYRSNEPGILERNDIPFTLFDTAEYDVPGSFGVIITSREFLDEHPTVVEDFVRATMRGLEDALADPAAAAATAMAMVDAGGNPNFLSAEGETFRWTTDAASLTEGQPVGTGIGIPDAALLQAEVEAYAEVGLFDGEIPDIAPFFDAAPIESVYDGDRVIWPG